MEKDILPAPGKWYFSLRESLPELELDKYAYAEFNRLVIHPAFRTGVLTKRIFEAIQGPLSRWPCPLYLRFQRCHAGTLLQAAFHPGRTGRRRLATTGYSTTSANTKSTKMVLFYGDTKPFFVVTGDADGTALLDPITDLAFTE